MPRCREHGRFLKRRTGEEYGERTNRNSTTYLLLSVVRRIRVTSRVSHAPAHSMSLTIGSQAVAGSDFVAMTTCKPFVVSNAEPPWPEAIQLSVNQLGSNGLVHIGGSCSFGALEMARSRRSTA